MQKISINEERDFKNALRTHSQNLDFLGFLVCVMHFRQTFFCIDGGAKGGLEPGTSCPWLNRDCQKVSKRVGAIHRPILTMVMKHPSLHESNHAPRVLNEGSLVWYISVKLHSIYTISALCYFALYLKNNSCGVELRPYKKLRRNNIV